MMSQAKERDLQGTEAGARASRLETHRGWCLLGRRLEGGRGVQDGTTQGWDFILDVTGSSWGFKEEKDVILSRSGEEEPVATCATDGGR